ncbi:unnamed protein product, partial [Closterium sp. NIES-53]
PPCALSQREPLSPPQLRKWFAWRTRLWIGAAGAGGSATGGTGAAGAGGTAGVGAGGTRAGATRVTGAAGPRGARTGGTGAGGAGGAVGVGAGGTGAGAARVTGAAGPGGARTGGTGAAGAGGAVGVGARDTGRPRLYFVPLLQQVLRLPTSLGLAPPLLCPPPEQSQLTLQSASPLRAPSPYTKQTGGLKERREPMSRPPSPVRIVRTGRRVPRPRPPPAVPDPESDLVCCACPTVPRLLATIVTDPSFESAAAFALVPELVDFAAACRLDYAASLVL